MRFNRIAKVYDKYRSEYPSSFINYLIKTFSLNKYSICVDIGCGTGKFSKRIAPFVKLVYGVDKSPEMTRIAEKHIKNFEGIICNAENITMPDNSVDAVFFSHSFHWIDKERALSEANRILNEDGMLAIFWINCLNRNNNYYCELQDLVKEYHNYPASDYRGIGTYELMVNSKLFSKVREKSFQFAREFTHEEYLGNLRSKSYVSDDIPEELLSEFMQRSKQVIYKHFNTNKIKEFYSVDLYYAASKKSSRSTS